MNDAYIVTGHNKKKNEQITIKCVSLHTAILHAKACITATIFNNEEIIGKFQNGKLIA